MKTDIILAGGILSKTTDITGSSFQINLDVLQIRLGGAHDEHLDRGCRLKPKFCIETRFGLTALFIVCQDCSTFEVVI
jgi:hypothetical protein